MLRELRRAGTMSPMKSRISVHHVNNNANSRVNRVDQVILAIDLIDIDVIVVAPISRPSFGVSKPISAVIEAAMVSSFYVEMVRAAKVRVKALFTNAADIAVLARVMTLLLDTLRRDTLLLMGAILFDLLLLSGDLLALFFRVTLVAVGLFFSNSIL